jgi:hypothetical protein
MKLSVLYLWIVKLKTKKNTDGKIECESFKTKEILIF